MTEIKIPFAKVEVKKIVDANQPTNAEGLEIDISPIFFDNFYSKVSPNTCINKLKCAFFDGAEKEIYNELLDEKKVGFELSFEKEKVDFNVVGVDKREPDNSKIRINYVMKDSANGSLGIIFKPQFTGVVKITPTSQNDDGKDRPNDNGGNNDNGGGNKNNNDNSEDTKQKITNLQNQINALEEKLKNQPASDNTADKEKLKQLKTEIQALKKQKGKPQNENKEQKNNNFPYGLVIGGGIVVFLLLIAVIFFWQRSRRKQD